MEPKFWIYTEKDGFIETPNPLPNVRGEDEKEWLERLGYENWYVSFRDLFDDALRIARRLDSADNEYVFLAQMITLDQFNYVLIRNMPDLLAFLNYILPIIENINKTVADE